MKKPVQPKQKRVSHALAAFIKRPQADIKSAQLKITPGCFSCQQA
jgi:hypothetical protein